MFVALTYIYIYVCVCVRARVYYHISNVPYHVSMYHISIHLISSLTALQPRLCLCLLRLDAFRSGLRPKGPQVQTSQALQAGSATWTRAATKCNWDR